ncbi:MAG TPA: glycerate kinase [Bacillus bacterium]|uniref:Glycerate kinase n=1 Tax=Siminovitchia fordii TaxID=254759 RepID=A0ABQ4KBP2_9BACI|nr:glycerate kinase [Siminovitchia fordii]GIN22288.1 glycerate kinase [Siminovitchia fordii]HBZ10766.1 glycerate kinase [Bacillus sp. (in: firmicutes)]
MNIVIATDSFKGSASSLEVAGFIEKGIRRVTPGANIVKLPLADGGEGTVEALTSTLEGRYVEREVTGPLGEKVKAKFGIINDRIAVIEMAEASGLTLIKEEDKNPFITTTYGTGELIKAALDFDVKEILIGIGGSATNDGGVGMAQALGGSFKDADNLEIPFGARALEKIQYIDLAGLDKRLAHTKITVLSDVTNPLCGENGASFVYGPQKGASSSEEIQELDSLLRSYGEKLEEKLGRTFIDVVGSGAAGGLGAGLMAFCNAEVNSGIEKILEIIRLREYVESADLVITGEGKMDFQSVQGKAPIGVAKIANAFKVPVVAVVGSEGDQANQVYKHGIDLVIDIINKPMKIQEAMKNVEKLTEDAGEKVMRAYLLRKFLGR